MRADGLVGRLFNMPHLDDDLKSFKDIWVISGGYYAAVRRGKPIFFIAFSCELCLILGQHFIHMFLK